eukprot:TRINITY_DN46348_c0_g2_i2.p1 TRINITY_DN46348_c0_g2~~TRINITY_DN46348_c0_g2_i2.p1  ORF type:complete len:222 (-),score=-19.07 TRINITY_DN46348_c0_g2_i2:64-729(-)
MFLNVQIYVQPIQDYLIQNIHKIHSFFNKNTYIIMTTLPQQIMSPPPFPYVMQYDAKRTLKIKIQIKYNTDRYQSFPSHAKSLSKQRDNVVLCLLIWRKKRSTKKIVKQTNDMFYIQFLIRKYCLVDTKIFQNLFFLFFQLFTSNKNTIPRQNTCYIYLKIWSGRYQDFQNLLFLPYVQIFTGTRYQGKKITCQKTFLPQNNFNDKQNSVYKIKNYTKANK